MSPFDAEVCGRCRQSLLAHGCTVLANTDIVVCRDCERDWLLSAESRRLRAISSSLFAEFMERERCEQIASGQKQGVEP